MLKSIVATATVMFASMPGVLQAEPFALPKQRLLDLYFGYRLPQKKALNNEAKQIESGCLQSRVSCEAMSHKHDQCDSVFRTCLESIPGIQFLVGLSRKDWGQASQYKRLYQRGDGEAPIPLLVLDGEQDRDCLRFYDYTRSPDGTKDLSNQLLLESGGWRPLYIYVYLDSACGVVDWADHPVEPQRQFSSSFLERVCKGVAQVQRDGTPYSP